MGRWNGPGRKVIYCADSIALAFLENMIRRQGVGFNSDFKIMILDIPRDIKIVPVDITKLKAGWRDFKDYSACQSIGNDWYDKGQFAILKAPSAVLPEAFNYVINTMHPRFAAIKLIGVTDLVPDERIEEILKKYKI
jgi:RES domain-containing protein